MYVDPADVNSPRGRWKLKKVLANTGRAGWSAAEGVFDGEPRLGLRWNGADNETGPGNPQSRGHATWFLVPHALERVLRSELERMANVDRPVCELTRPDGYQHGAWRIELTLPPIAIERGLGDLPFELPKLEHRTCHPEREYFRAGFNGFVGQCVKGKWFGDVYTNGIAEDDNPVTPEAVKDAFRQALWAALASALAQPGA